MKFQQRYSESLANFIVKGVTDESWAAYESTLKNIRPDDYIPLYQTAASQ